MCTPLVLVLLELCTISPPLPHPAEPVAGQRILVKLNETDDTRVLPFEARLRAHRVQLAAVSREHDLRVVRPAAGSLHDTLGDRASRGIANRSRDLVSEWEARHVWRTRRKPKDAATVELLPIYVLDAPDTKKSITDLCARLERHPAIAYAEVDQRIEMHASREDPLFAEQWTMHNIGQTYPTPYARLHGLFDADVDATEAWKAYDPVISPVVAVIDSGIDPTHPDIVDNLWFNDDGHYGWDFVEDHPNPIDTHGHGTHCAGIVGATHGNGIGVAGMCPNVRIMALRILPHGSVSAAIDAIHYAVANGADVLSNSWGTLGYSRALRDAVDFAHSQGVVVVASAGNNTSATQHNYPANYRQTVCVAATTSNDRHATWTNYGQNTTLSAPGLDVLSLRAAGTDMCAHGFGPHDVCIYQDEYYMASGTSMACPHVAGTFALLIGQDPQMPIEELVDRVRGTTDDIFLRNPTIPMGSGRLNAHTALTAPRGPRFNLMGYAFYELSGDGDGQPEPGEVLTLELVLENKWVPATKLRLQASTEDPLVSLTRDHVVLGSIPSGGRVTAQLELVLDDGAHLSHDVELHLSFLSPGYSTTTSVTLPVLWAQTPASPYEAGGRYLTTADLDLDGAHELIVSGPHELCVRDLSGEPRFCHEFDEHIGRALACNLDSTPDLEVVVFRQGSSPAFNGNMSAFHHDGSAVAGLWGNIPPSTLPSYGRLLAADLTGDGVDEVIASGETDGLFVLQADGAPLRQGWPFIENGGAYAAVADLDADGSPEVIGIYDNHPYGNHVIALHADGSTMQGWPTTVHIEETLRRTPPVVADFDGDGTLEVATATRDGVVYLFSHRGALYSDAWPVELPPAVHVYCLAAADIDLDGAPELIVGGTRRLTFALEADGDIVPGWPHELSSRYATNYVEAIADINGDGIPEIVMSNRDAVWLLNPEGTALSPRIPASETFWSAAAIVDADSDGLLEFVVTREEDVVVFETPGVASSLEWSQFGNDARHSGLYRPIVAHSEGQLAVDRSIYGINETVLITLRDADLDYGAFTRDSVTIRVASEVEATGDDIVLIETGESTGIFQAALALDTGKPAVDGILQVGHDNTLQVTYEDQAPSTTLTATATIDAQPPVISDVDVETGYSFGFYADVTWTTDKPSTSRVFYGGGIPVHDEYDSMPTTAHRIRIRDIAPMTAYHFYVESIDRHANGATDDNDGRLYDLFVPVGTDLTSIKVLFEGDEPDDVDLKVVHPSDFQYPHSFHDGPGGRHFIAAPLGIDIAVFVEIETPFGYGRFVTPLETTPFNALLDFERVVIQILSDGVPIDTVVRIHAGCELVFSVGTDEDGLATILVPRDFDYELQIGDITPRWVGPLVATQGAMTIDLTHLPPNIRGFVHRSGAGSAAEQVGIMPFDGERDDVDHWLTDGHGLVEAWACPGRSYQLRGGVFPDDVASAAITAPAVGDDDSFVALDLSPTSISSSHPPDGAIDARQPTDPLSGGPAGWDAVTLQMTDTSVALSTSDFRLDHDEAEGPTITNVIPSGPSSIDLLFSRPLTAGMRYRVVHVPSRSSVGIGFLPGDVDGDGRSTATDLAILQRAVDGQHDLQLYQADIDRNGRIGPPDIAALKDLLNGTSGPAWLDRALRRPPALLWTIENQGMATRYTPTTGGAMNIMGILDSTSLPQDITVDPVSGDVVFSCAQQDGHRIMRARRDGSHLTTILQDLPEIGGIAIDAAGEYLYWTDREQRAVRRVQVGDATIEDVAIDLPEVPFDIIVHGADPVVYLSMGNLIASIEPDSGRVHRLIEGEKTEPIREIALDPTTHMMYWYHEFNHPTGRAIWQRPLAGGLPERIVWAEASVVWGMALNTIGGKIYWVNPLGVRQANLDGTQLETIVPLPPTSYTRMVFDAAVE